MTIEMILFCVDYKKSLFSELTAVKNAATRSNTICMLSVPANMTCHDLLQFTAACHENIQHFRILRDDNPDQYMALITFRNSVRRRRSL